MSTDATHVAPASSSGGSDVMDGFAAYGRIRATIGKWVAYFFGALMIIGGIVLIAMAAAGTIGTDGGCTTGTCCDPNADLNCECAACEFPKYPDCKARKDCSQCKTCDDTTLSRGAYIGMGAGLIVVAVITIVISTIVARLAYESKGFAAVSGGVGAVSDIVNVASMAARGATGVPVMGVM